MDVNSKREQFEATREKITYPAGKNKKENEIRFNIDLLKESKFKSILSYYDSISMSPLEYLLTGLLTCLSGAIGKNVYFKLTNTINIYLNIWSVIIGPSTIMRKTTALNTAKSDLQRLDIKFYGKYKEEYKKYIQSKASKNGSKHIEEEGPKRKYLLMPQDSTIESLSDILSYSSRGLLYHSEFGAFLAQLNRGYSADAKQFLTNVWDVPESYEVSRVTKENSMLIRPYLSILGASTIDWIRENSTDSDLRTGFFARFLYSIRNKPDKEYIELLKLRSLTKKSEHYTDTRDVYEFLTGIDEQRELEITRAAEHLHMEYDKTSYLELLQSENENELSFKARLIVYTLKFAAIIALADKRIKISENDMNDAVCIAGYYKKNIEQLLNDELTRDEFSRLEQKVLDVLIKENGKAVRSTVMNNTRIKAKDLDEVINNLIQKEKIVISRAKHEYNKKSIQYYEIKECS